VLNLPPERARGQSPPFPSIPGAPDLIRSLHGILLALAASRKTYRAWASDAYLAQRLDVSPRRVRQLARELTDAGFLGASADTRRRGDDVREEGRMREGEESPAVDRADSVEVNPAQPVDLSKEPASVELVWDSLCFWFRISRMKGKGYAHPSIQQIIERCRRPLADSTVSQTLLADGALLKIERSRAGAYYWLGHGGRSCA
jgi:hypothetical protein